MKARTRAPSVGFGNGVVDNGERAETDVIIGRSLCLDEKRGGPRPAVGFRGTAGHGPHADGPGKQGKGTRSVRIQYYASRRMRGWSGQTSMSNPCRVTPIMIAAASF